MQLPSEKELVEQTKEVFKVGLWIALTPAGFLRCLTNKQMGEQMLSSTLVSAILWALISWTALSAIANTQKGISINKDMVHQTLAVGVMSPKDATTMAEDFNKVMSHESLSLLKIDRATILLFYGLCTLCLLLQILDWWRRDTTHGTYILSKNIGEPRLPIGWLESAFYWVVIAAGCSLLHLYFSSFIFILAFWAALLEFSLIWWKQRMELLNQRDAFLISEIAGSNETRVIGLQGAMKLAGVSGIGALKHKYQSLE